MAEAEEAEALEAEAEEAEALEARQQTNNFNAQL